MFFGKTLPHMIQYVLIKLREFHVPTIYMVDRIKYKISPNFYTW